MGERLREVRRQPQATQLDDLPGWGSTPAWPVQCGALDKGKDIVVDVLTTLRLLLLPLPLGRAGAGGLLLSDLEAGPGTPVTPALAFGDTAGLPV